MAVADVLAACVARRAAIDPGAWTGRWFEPHGLDRAGLLAACAAAGRTVGTAPVRLEAAEVAALAAAGLDWPVDAWGVDELARAALLLAAAERAPDDAPALVTEVYDGGDTRERQAVLRVLALLREPARWVALARDAARSNVQPVFDALACENPYPAAHLPGDAFNQLVLKALFTGVPLARILGLARRRTPELTRMVDDYVQERRAAGRVVPADVELARGAPEGA